MPKRYLDEFFKRGSLKIGTLYEYRNVEQYGTSVGDDAEGISIRKYAPGSRTVDLDSNTPEANYLRLLFKEVGTGVKIILHPGASVHIEDQVKDFYIYCAASEYDQAVMMEFGGSCMEIFKPAEFFKEISHVIRHKGSLLHHGPISYMSRERGWDQPIEQHPAMMKEPKYEYQKEARTIWNPSKSKIEPLYIDVPRAIKYCRPFPA